MKATDDRDALTRVRELCLRMPETSETQTWGHPNFRAGKRTFAAYEWVEGRPTLAFRLGTSGVEQLMLLDKRFFVSPTGRGQWASLWMDGRVDWPLVEQFLYLAYRQVALKRMIKALEEG